MKVAEIAVTPVLAKSDTLGRDCQTEGSDFWRSGGKPQVNLEKGKADAVADKVSSALLWPACLNIRRSKTTNGSQGDHIQSL